MIKYEQDLQNKLNLFLENQIKDKNDLESILNYVKSNLKDQNIFNLNNNKYKCNFCNHQKNSHYKNILNSTISGIRKIENDLTGLMKFIEVPNDKEMNEFILRKQQSVDESFNSSLEKKVSINQNFSFFSCDSKTLEKSQTLDSNYLDKQIEDTNHLNDEKVYYNNYNQKEDFQMNNIDENNDRKEIENVENNQNEISVDLSHDSKIEDYENLQEETQENNKTIVINETIENEKNKISNNETEVSSIYKDLSKNINENNKIHKRVTINDTIDSSVSNLNSQNEEKDNNLKIEKKIINRDTIDSSQTNSNAEKSENTIIQSEKDDKEQEDIYQESKKSSKSHLINRKKSSSLKKAAKQCKDKSTLNIFDNSDLMSEINNYTNGKHQKSNLANLSQYDNESRSNSNELDETVNNQKVFKFKSQKIEEYLGDTEKVEEIKRQLFSTEQGAIAMDEDNIIIQTNDFITSQLLFDKVKLLDKEVFSCVPPSDNLVLRVKVEEINNDNYKNHINSQFNMNFQDINVKPVLFECNFTFINDGNTIIRVLWLRPPQEENHYLIDQKSTPQMIWLGFISFVLTFLLIQMPYDMAFNDSMVIDSLEVPITIIFLIDIIVNFNLTQEEDDVLITNRQLIARNYFSDWFVIDVVSTMPTSFIQNKIINTNVFRSLKIIRIVRFIKLIRLLRLSKVQSIMKIINEETMKKIYNFIKQNKGYLDLVKNMMLIQIFAHFYSIMFWAIEGELCDNNNPCQRKMLLEDLNHELSPFNIQNIILWDHIVVALGLGAMKYQNDWEIYIMIGWMFIGLSLFGQGIGNISSQLNYANKQDLEQMETFNQFSELFILNNIDPRLQQLVINNLEKNFAKQMDKELHKQSNNLSSHVFDQLELSLLEKFTTSFKMFEKLHVKALRLIKHHMLQDTLQVIIRKDDTVKNLYFVIEGRINIYRSRSNSNMKLVNQFEINEIFGMKEFYAQFLKKQKIDVEKVFQIHAEFTDIRLKEAIKQQTMNKLNLTLLNKLKKGSAKKITKSKPIDDFKSIQKRMLEVFEEKEIEFKPTISITDDFLKYNYNAISSDNTKQLSVPFSIIEDIFFSDIDSFYQIQKQDLNQNRHLTEDEIKESDEIVSKQKIEENPAVIIQPTGEIQDTNVSFNNRQNLIDIEGKSVYSLLKVEGASITNLAETQEKIVEISGDIQTEYITLEVNGPYKLINFKQSNSLKLHKYAKSLISLKIIQISPINI